jgi:hypothetical protein
VIIALPDRRMPGNAFASVSRTPCEPVTQAGAARRDCRARDRPAACSSEDRTSKIGKDYSPRTSYMQVSKD